MSKFFKSVLDHVLKEVLVESLANSRWFQRFAVSTNKMVQEAKQKGTQHTAGLDETITKATTSASEVASAATNYWQAFRKEVQEEFKKNMEAQKLQPPGKR